MVNISHISTISRSVACTLPIYTALLLSRSRMAPFVAVMTIICPSARLFVRAIETGLLVCCAAEATNGSSQKSRTAKSSVCFVFMCSRLNKLPVDRGAHPVRENEDRIAHSAEKSFVAFGKKLAVGRFDLKTPGG